MLEQKHNEELNADANSVSQPIAKPHVVGSQSQRDFAALCNSDVVQIVRSLLDGTRELPGHLEYMRFKGLTIVSKSYLSWLKWLCLIGWSLAISIFSAILLSKGQ